MSDEKPADRVVITDWRGLITNRDPRDGDSALVDVQNVVFDKAGEARVRAGHKQVTLANGGAVATVTITAFTELNAGDKVNLIATDGTNYDFTNGDQSSVAGTWESTTSNDQTATNLMNVINTSSGPAGTRFSASVVGAVVTITQNTVGEGGDTTVTLTDSGTAGMTSTNFVGGVDASDIVVMAPFHSPGFDWVMVQDDGGDVRAGSNPTV